MFKLWCVTKIIICTCHSVTRVTHVRRIDNLNRARSLHTPSYPDCPSRRRRRDRCGGGGYANVNFIFSYSGQRRQQCMIIIDFEIRRHYCHTIYCSSRWCTDRRESCTRADTLILFLSLLLLLLLLSLDWTFHNVFSVEYNLSTPTGSRILESTRATYAPTSCR